MTHVPRRVFRSPPRRVSLSLLLLAAATLAGCEGSPGFGTISIGGVPYAGYEGDGGGLPAYGLPGYGMGAFGFGEEGDDDWGAAWRGWGGEDD